MSRKILAKKVRDDIVRVAIELGYTPDRTGYLEKGKYPDEILNLALGSYETGCRAAGLDPPRNSTRPIEENREPKILLFDIETSPYLVWAWGLWDQNIGLNQIVKERHLLSFAAKWYGQPYVIYKDQRAEPDTTSDKGICEALAALFSEADVVITQNGKKFDERFVKGRMLLHGLKPYRPFVHVDVLQLSRKFDLTSRKLEYMSEKFSEHKKLKHEEFPGMDLWTECLKGNQRAWEVMREYNRMDVISLEPVYEALRPWGIGVNLNAFHSACTYRCQCGSEEFQRDKDLARTSAGGLFERFQCKRCGAWHQAKGESNNFISGQKKTSMKTPKAN